VGGRGRRDRCGGGREGERLERVFVMRRFAGLEGGGRRRRKLNRSNATGGGTWRGSGRGGDFGRRGMHGGTATEFGERRGGRVGEGRGRR
jgi:hypothetical protein